MKIEFVTHSCVVYRRGDVHLICDPWLEGTAFDDGWALLSPPVFRVEDFAAITHIWFSHEHPDHFSPRSLSTIDPKHRRNITVMFHASDDGKIREYCEGLGFGGFLELSGDRVYTLGDGFAIQCDRWADGDDSWLFVSTPEGSVLNLNDCQINRPEDARQLRDRLGPVDALLTQFSISSWDGNVEDLERRMSGARVMLDRIVMQSTLLEAKHVIPFASFIWCCHEENAYMNEAIASPRAAAEVLRHQTSAQPVVLYPGDCWNVGDAHDSYSAIERYEGDQGSIAQREPYKSAPVPIDELLQIAQRFQDRLNTGLSPVRRRLRAVKSNIRHQFRHYRARPLGFVMAGLQLVGLRTRPARIWLTDHQTSVTFDLISGLNPADFHNDECDIEISSAALAYALRFLWGGESLFVNGRFREVYPGGRTPLFEFLWIASAMNHSAGASARPL